MTLRDFIPPVLAQAGALVRRSFASSARAFLRGDDVVDGSPVRLSRPYAQSAWVHAAVQHVAGEISGRPLKWYQGEQEVEDPAFLAWWEAPAWGPAVAYGQRGRLSQAEFLRDLASWAKLEGEFFLIFDDSWSVAGRLRRNPAALNPCIIAHPQRMQLIVQAGEVAGYRYTDAGGRQLTLLPEQVVHWKSFNPYDSFRGLGSLEAATVAAEASFHTGVYLRELMRNNGDQGFIVIGKSGVASDEQREQIIADLRTKRAALRGGIAKDLFLTGDITVERPKEQAGSTDLNAGKSLSQQEVFVAFGVPPSMAEVKASYSVGKDSDYYQLIIRTCLPLGTAIAGALAPVGSRMRGATLSALIDWDDHPVMVEVRNSRIETALRLWSAGMPMARVNDYLDLGMPEFDGWEQGYLPFSVVPVFSVSGDAPAEPTADPSLAEPADLDPDVERLRLLTLARQRLTVAAVRSPEPSAEPAAEACACGCAPLDALLEQVDKDRDPAQVSRWREHMRQRREQMKGFESRFRSALFQARAETLAKISAQGAKAAVRKATVADLVFSLGAFAAEFSAGMRKQHKLALDAAGKQVFAELGRDDPFQFAPADVLSFVSGRENKLSAIPPEVFGRISRQLQEGLDAGDSTDQLAARVRSEFNAIDRGRAQVIAQTEVAAAYGYGRNEAMQKAGVQYKAWLTSGNQNVRPAHLEAGLTYPAEGGIPLDEPFIVGGERLMYPGDPNGSPANTINCHCIQIAVESPDPL